MGEKEARGGKEQLVSAMLNITALVRRVVAGSPWLKIGCWLGFIALVASGLQLAFWLGDLDLSVAGGAGRTIVIIAAIGSLLYLMLNENRPIADFGLALDHTWWQKLLGGLSLGFICYLGYFTLACLAGVFTVDMHPFSFRRAGSAFTAALTCMPLATSQQLIFSGYLLGILRDRYSRGWALLFSALLFASLERFDQTTLTSPAASARLFVSMTLFAILLGSLRLRLGSIPFSVGTAAGFLMVRRVIGKLGDVAYVPSADLASWFAPANDPRQGPILWGLLACGIGISFYALRRYGETKPEAQTGLDANFKRLLPFSHLNALAPVDVWLHMLIDARFRVGLIYVPRLIWILATSTINTVLSWPERFLLPLVMRHRIPDPLFVVGVHRSGTTHLHNLLALDPQFCTSRQYHVLNSIGFLLTGWITTPLLAPFMTWKRPMDAMDVTIFTPQEEEFAIAGMCVQSPYWGHTFPQRRSKYDAYVFIDRASPRDRAKWMSIYQFFLRKLTFLSSRTPVLKSPYNTGRVAILREMFPAAKFVHIVRHPHTVYRSNMKLAREAFPFWQLQEPDPKDCYETRFLDNYFELEDTFYRDAAKLPAKDVIDIHFDELERDPIGVIRRIYNQLGLKYSEEFHQRLERYMATVADYKKNEFKPLPEELAQKIDAKMGPFLKRWGYDKARKAA